MTSLQQTQRRLEILAVVIEKSGVPALAETEAGDFIREISSLLHSHEQLLEASRRDHYHCDDSWFCCGKCRHPDHQLDDHESLPGHSGHHTRRSGTCNCDADAWNARVEKELTY